MAISRIVSVFGSQVTLPLLYQNWMHVSMVFKFCFIKGMIDSKLSKLLPSLDPVCVRCVGPKSAGADWGLLTYRHSPAPLPPDRFCQRQVGNVCIPCLPALDRSSCRGCCEKWAMSEQFILRKEIFVLLGTAFNQEDCRK